MTALSLSGPDRGLSPAMLAAIAAAVVVHVGGACWFVSQGWVGERDAVAAGQSVHVRLSTPLPAPVSMAPTEVPTPEVPTHHDSPLAPDREGEPASLLVTAPTAAGGDATIATAYLPPDELDALPAPEAAWVLDELLLQRAGQATLRVQLWVSATGHIDRVAVLQATPLGDWAERAVALMHETPMRPAERLGRHVASTLVVEIASDLESLQ